MNILFVIENYLPHIGGVEVVFRNLAEGLVKNGHTATIITHRMKGAARNETINGVKVKRISCFGSRYLFSFLGIPAAVQAAAKADIVHTTTFNGVLPAWVAAKLNRKPLVVTVHEVWLGKWKDYTDFGWAKALVHEIFERAIYSLPFVNRYVAVSNSTGQQLIRIGKDEKKVSVIYNGVDYAHFNPQKYDGEKARRKYLLQNKYVLLVYGRPGPSKGIEYAIAAMAEITQKIPSAKMMLMLSYDKQYNKKHRRLLELIKKLGLQDAIVNIPPVTHEELPAYIKAADCVIVPSLSEGFGYTAAEAAAMGKPIVASNTTSLPEVVSGKHILVPPGSSHEIALAVESAYKKGYHETKLRRFMIAENVTSYIRTYKELLHKA